MNKKAMYKLSYGLFVLTAKDAEKDNGCIINTAVQAASEPNQLSICVNKANYTHNMIQKTGKFTVSVLSQEAQFGLFEQFGFQSGRNVNKFEAFEKCAAGFKWYLLYYRRNKRIYFGNSEKNGKTWVPIPCLLVRSSDMEVLSDIPSVTYEYYSESYQAETAGSRKNRSRTEHMEM